jgi:thiol-disulfide isomerase/thioredoxin
MDMDKRYRYLLISVGIFMMMMACKTISEPIVNLYSSSTQDIRQNQPRSQTTVSEKSNSQSAKQTTYANGMIEEGDSKSTLVTVSPTGLNSSENEGGSNQYPAPGQENGNEPYPGPGDATADQNLAVLTETQTPSPQSATQTTLTPQTSITPSPTNTRIPIEMPAWIASEIEASDPDSVELSSGSYQFFEFFAYWCGTCLALAPEIHTLETHYGSRINFIYLDIDDPANDIYKKQLNYRQQPQFYLVDREGKVIREWQGTVAFDELVSAFESILSIQQ